MHEVGPQGRARRAALCTACQHTPQRVTVLHYQVRCRGATASRTTCKEPALRWRQLRWRQRQRQACAAAPPPASRALAQPPPPARLTLAVRCLLHNEAAVLGADAPGLGLEQHAGGAARRSLHPCIQQPAVAAAATAAIVAAIAVALLVAVLAATPVAVLVAAPASALVVVIIVVVVVVILVVFSRVVRGRFGGRRRRAAGREGGQLGAGVWQRQLVGGGGGLGLEHVGVGWGGLRQAVDGGDDGLQAAGKAGGVELRRLAQTASPVAAR